MKRPKERTINDMLVKFCDSNYSDLYGCTKCPLFDTIPAVNDPRNDDTCCDCSNYFKWFETQVER